jgi:hypothetical protein
LRICTAQNCYDRSRPTRRYSGGGTQRCAAECWALGVQSLCGTIDRLAEVRRVPVVLEYSRSPF